MKTCFNAATVVLMTAALYGCQSSQFVQSGSSTYGGPGYASNGSRVNGPLIKKAGSPKGAVSTNAEGQPLPYNEATSSAVSNDPLVRMKKPAKTTNSAKPTTVNEAASSAIKPGKPTKKLVTRRSAKAKISLSEKTIGKSSRSLKKRQVSKKRKTSRKTKLVLRQRNSKLTANKIENSGAYRALVTRYARANGVPVKLAHAVVKIESNYRPNSRGKAGEVGLMQIKPATARGEGFRGSKKALFNPETNIKYGMRYLAGAYRKGGGSTCGTILKYNAGHGAKRMNKVSAAYCRKVKKVMRRG